MFRASHTPPLNYLLDDLLTRDAAAIARHLGVSVRTFKRWKAADDAPRSVMLALFFETRWGVSQVHCEAYNRAMYADGLADSLRRENAALLVRIARLERLGDFGASNAPTLRPGGVQPLRPHPVPQAGHLPHDQRRQQGTGQNHKRFVGD